VSVPPPFTLMVAVSEQPAQKSTAPALLEKCFSQTPFFCHHPKGGSGKGTRFRGPSAWFFFGFSSPKQSARAAQIPRNI